ncbi:MAG: prenyltransferase [Pseudomonadota bacterium]
MGRPPACALPVCRAGTGRHADRSRVSRKGKASPEEAGRGKYSPPASPERVTAEVPERRDRGVHLTSYRLSLKSWCWENASLKLQETPVIISLIRQSFSVNLSFENLRQIPGIFETIIQTRSGQQYHYANREEKRIIMKELRYLLGPMRIPFLVLPPACVLLGFGTAIWRSHEISIFYLVLALIGALSAHISVNALNEYFDFKSGLDFKTERTPFSGGSGTLPARPDMARSALATGLVTFAITGLVGLYFLYVRGLSLLPLGAVGLVIIFTYTVWLTRYPILCLIAPGLGFGTLMVMGTDFVLTGEYSWTAFIASLVPFFLVSDLLLLNQFPDAEADQTIGRRHLPIVLGKQTSSLIYGFFLLLAYLSIIFGVYLHYLPKASLIGLATIVIAVPASVGAFRYTEDIKRLTPYLNLNVIINIATPVLVAAGLFLG